MKLNQTQPIKIYSPCKFSQFTCFGKRIQSSYKVEFGHLFTVIITILIFLLNINFGLSHIFKIQNFPLHFLRFVQTWTKLVFNKKFGEELTLNPSFRDGALAPRISSEGTLAYLFRNSRIFVISVFHVEALAYLGTKKLRRMKIFFCICKLWNFFKIILMLLLFLRSTFL